MKRMIQDIADEKRFGSINVEYLTSLSQIDFTSDGRAAVQVLISIFLATGPKILNDMETSFHERDYRRIENDAKHLALGSRNLGARELARACDKVMSAAEQKSLGLLSSALQTLRNEFGRVSTELSVLAAEIETQLHDRSL